MKVTFLLISLLFTLLLSAQINYAKSDGNEISSPSLVLYSLIYPPTEGNSAKNIPTNSIKEASLFFSESLSRDDPVALALLSLNFSVATSLTPSTSVESSISAPLSPLSSSLFPSSSFSSSLPSSLPSYLMKRKDVEMTKESEMEKQEDQEDIMRTLSVRCNLFHNLQNVTEAVIRYKNETIWSFNSVSQQRSITGSMITSNHSIQDALLSGESIIYLFTNKKNDVDNESKISQNVMQGIIHNPFKRSKNDVDGVVEINWKTWVSMVIVLMMLLSLLLDIYKPYFIVLSAVTLFIAFDIISLSDGVHGYANEGMITVALLFPVVQPLSDNPLIGKIAAVIFGSKSRFLRFNLLRMMVPVMLLSVFLNNTPIVALFIPIIKDWCRKNNISPSKFLIPLSYASIFGGISSLIGTSTNLVGNGLMKDFGLPELGFFEIGYAGFPCAVIAVLYLVTLGFWILPNKGGLFRFTREHGTKFLSELIIHPNSKLIGMNVKKAKLKLGLKNLELVQIIRYKKMDENSSTLANFADQMSKSFNHINEESINIHVNDCNGPKKDNHENISTGSSIINNNNNKDKDNEEYNSNTSININDNDNNNNNNDGEISKSNNESLKDDPEEEEGNIVETGSNNQIILENENRDSIPKGLSSAESDSSSKLNEKKTDHPPKILPFQPSTKKVTYIIPVPDDEILCSGDRLVFAGNVNEILDVHSRTGIVDLADLNPKFKINEMLVGEEKTNITDDSYNDRLWKKSNSYDDINDHHIVLPYVRSNVKNLDLSLLEDPPIPAHSKIRSELIEERRRKLRALQEDLEPMQDQELLVSSLFHTSQSLNSIAGQQSNTMKRFSPTIPSNIVNFSEKESPEKHEEKRIGVEEKIQAVEEIEENSNDSPEFFEVVLGNECPFVGRKVKNTDFQSIYGAVALAIRSRSGTNSQTETRIFPKTELRLGDTVLLLARSSFYDKWIDSRHFYVISRCNVDPVHKKKDEIQIRGKKLNIWWYKYLCIPIFIAMIVAAICGVPMLKCALFAAIAMVLFRFIDPMKALKSVSWDLIILIGASFAIGRGLSKSGLAHAFASLLLVIQIPNWLIIGVIFFMTQLVTALITNNAAVAIFFPLGIATAQRLGLNPRPFAIAVTLAGSCDYSTPLGYQTNLMVQGPGGYSFFDYIKVGLPLNILFCLLNAILIPLIWPL